MNDLFIKEIEHAEYKNLINRTSEYINEILIHGQRLLSTIDTTTHPSNHSDSVILLLFRETLETLDGIHSLFKGSSINVCDILFRNIFELSLSLYYIFLDDDLIKQRALSYDVDRIHNKIEFYAKLNSNYRGYNNFKEIIGSDILSNFSPTKLQSLSDNLKSIFDKYDDYKEVNLAREAKKKKLNKKNSNHKKPKWYQIYSSASNLRELSKLVNMEKYYLILYSNWSTKIHGGSAMDGFVVINNKSKLSNPKVPKKPADVATKISFILTFMSSIYRPLYNYYLTEDDIISFINWHFTMREQEKEICAIWESLNFKYED